jgi:benzoyl-CoA reductase/2-hydroxyglutaryl-CoA dehydratase subunit BcrC/BadD/HgdB
MCDLTPETDQMLHEFYSIPVAYIDNIMDIKGEDWPRIDPRKVRYLSTEMKNAMETFSRLFNCKISQSKIRQAIEMRNKVNDLISKIRQLTQKDPTPMGHNNYAIVSHLGASCIKRVLREGVDVLNILREELEKRINEGKGILEKGAPRVILSMAPHDPAFADTIEKMGLTIYGTASVPIPSSLGPSSYNDLWEQVAESLMKRRGGQYSSWAYILQLRELCQAWHVDGLIFRTHFSCRQYSIFPLKAKEVIEKEFNIPVLLLEGDYCDFRSRSTRDMLVKLETFAEIIKSSKQRE